MKRATGRPPSTLRHMRVWDAAVRILHGGLACLVAFNLIRDDGDLVHRQVGYAAVAVVLTRLLWGAFSTGDGRLAAMCPSVHLTVAYVRSLLRRQVPRYAGHDPLGLWMVWLLVLLLGVTGWLSRLDAFWGNDFLHDLHAWLAEGLLVAVFVHLIGVAGMSLLRRENLAAAMVSGWKAVDRGKGAAQELRT